jgi:hypothetical protein
MDGTSTLQRREGKSIYTCSPKTSHHKLANKIETSNFGNWNI